MGSPEMVVLDAGCGREQIYVDVPEDAYIVGMDVDEDALALNSRVDERLIGDIQRYPLPADTYDLVLCMYVLEHLDEPMLALDNMVQSLKPGGRLIFGIPHVQAPKSIITKATPHSFHVWAYRRFFNLPQAGTPGYGPYPAPLRWSLRPSSLKRWAAGRGVEMESLEYIKAPVIKDFWMKSAPRRVAWRALSGTWRVVTLNRLDPEISDIEVTIRKPATGHAG